MNNLVIAGIIVFLAVYIFSDISVNFSSSSSEIGSFAVLYSRPKHAS